MPAGAHLGGPFSRSPASSGPRHSRFVKPVDHVNGWCIFLLVNANSISAVTTILSAARNIIDYMDDFGRFIGEGGSVDAAIATWEWTIAMNRGRLRRA
jgi:hypothetical protein